MDCREARIYRETRYEAITAAQAREKSCEDMTDDSAEKWADLGYVL